MKRLVCWVLVAVMLLAALPAMATDSVRTSGDFQYTIKGNGTATVVGYTGTADIIIPQMLDGYTVTAIGDNAFYRESAMRQEISVTLPETVRSIGEFAFWNMDVRSINLPDALEYIGKGAFVGCNQITYRISSNHPAFAVIDDALYNKAQKELVMGKEGAVIPEGIRSIGDYACYGVPNCGITSEGIVLPSTIEKIGDYAFYGNEYTIELPDAGKLYINKGYETQYIKAIGNFDTTSAKNNYPFELLWGENLREIGKYAFAHTLINIRSQIANICTVWFSIPDSVTEIGEACFYEFGSSDYDAILIVISEGSQLQKIPAKAFYNEDGLVKRSCVIKCDAPITEVDDYAFYGNYIQAFNMQNITTLGKGAFMESSQNADIVIPASCKTVSEDAFNNARTNGYDILISDGVEGIEANAFNVNLTNEVKNHEPSVHPISPILLPTSLTSIALNAFRNDAEYIVERGSYAYRWADENAFNYTINGEEQNLDWLNG